MCYSSIYNEPQASMGFQPTSKDPVWSKNLVLLNCDSNLVVTSSQNLSKNDSSKKYSKKDKPLGSEITRLKNKWER